MAERGVDYRIARLRKKREPELSHRGKRGISILLRGGNIRKTYRFERGDAFLTQTQKRRARKEKKRSVSEKKCADTSQKAKRTLENTERGRDAVQILGAEHGGPFGRMRGESAERPGGRGHPSGQGSPAR